MQVPNSGTTSGGNARLAVLGGCGGIGRELVTTASKLGLRVAVLDLPASLERHPVPAGVTAYEVNATDSHSLEVAFKAMETDWGDLDGFVNLCGFMHENQMLAEIPQTTWQEIVDGNLTSAYLAAHHALPLLRKGQGGAITHVSSGLAQHIRPGFGAYAAAKSAVIALTKTLAIENAPSVRVNAVAPSAVDTAFLRGGTGRSDEDEELELDMDAYVRMIPMQRIATPPDIVEPILFLLSDAARYMTGQVLWVNGGAYMP